MSDDELMARVLLLLQEGRTLQEMRDELHIPLRKLQRVIRSAPQLLVDGWRVRVRGTVTAPSRGYTQESCVAALQAAATLANQTTISMNAYRELRKDHLDWPPGSAMYFPTWNDWLKRAGLGIRVTPAGFGAPTYTPEDYLNALNRVKRHYGRPFSQHEYDNVRLSHEPTSNAIRRRGHRSWRDACENIAPGLHNLKLWTMA